jgi:CubicO group peptidase (beta-lactamase class C family)
MKFFNEGDILNVDQRKRNITLEDVLTMRTGIQWNESIPYTDPRNSCIRMEASNDWVKFVINRPMDNEPGTVFEYNSGATQLLSFIIKKSTGMYIDKYAEKYLFGPLGIRSYYWKRTPTKLPDTEGGLYLEPLDLAKIGALYLADGVWQGKQILPKGWVQSTVKPHVEDVAPGSPTNNYGYGYQWWLMPNKNNPTAYIYTCAGYGGQYMFVVPGADLIAVFTGWNIYKAPRLHSNVIFDVLDSAKSPIESKDLPKL